MAAKCQQIVSRDASTGAQRHPGGVKG
jgi:hypothetical protein